MKTTLLVLVLLLVAVPAVAAGPTLPVEGATAVWLQPVGGEPGSLGAALSLLLPAKVVGKTVADLLRVEVIIHPVGGQVRVDPGLSLSLTSDVGIPVKVGVVALPLTSYKVGWFVGATLFKTDW